ncbi:MAG: hypothetical protein FD179_981 [Erysipelotrichaceae bacterium]|nr:MAG: hypothetical protein FD179_981 [Erysipelotrichaceae bacterium]
MGNIYLDLRRRKGVSQQHMASRMGLSLTAYRNKEKGRSKFFVDELIHFLAILEIDRNECAEFFLSETCHINYTKEKL